MKSKSFIYSQRGLVCSITIVAILLSSMLITSDCYAECIETKGWSSPGCYESSTKKGSANPQKPSKTSTTTPAKTNIHR